MIISTLLVASALAHRQPIRPADHVEKIEVTITTGQDDMRSDSAGMVFMQYSYGHHQVKPLKGPNETLGQNAAKTVTFIPEDSNMTVADIYRVRVDFSSGKATGFDDHWTLGGVKVVATIGSNTVIVYNHQNMGMLLQYTQHWSSPYFANANVPDMVNPSEIWATIEGGAGPNNSGSVLMDIETDDGRSWQGRRSGSQFNDPSYGGARVESIVTDKIAVQSIRAIRIGYGGPGNWSMRGIRFNYRGPGGETLELASFNEINVFFNGGGWWQAPQFRQFKRRTGDPISLMVVEVINGGDDLRRLELPREQSDHYNSKIDITFNIPILSPPRYASWLVNGDYARHVVNRTQPIIQQDGDEFPEGWTGSFGSFGRFSKIFRSVGEPFFVSSDLLNVTVRFKQGGGGNFSPTGSQGGGLIGALRQPDQWDLQGIIVSVQGPTGPLRRIFSDFGINRHMARDGDSWKSRNFETMLLRRI